MNEKSAKMKLGVLPCGSLYLNISNNAAEIKQPSRRSFLSGTSPQHYPPVAGKQLSLKNHDESEMF